MKKIELLSPAKSAEHGIEAICHGADAVYIGAPQFSARASAGNELSDIEHLIKYAHLFHAKVYVALNTILTNKELEEAEKLIHHLYNIGTDALIIQDFGITQLNLPPIALHASTQMDNRTLEKVQFLERAGFEQVVLARELSLKEISNIAQNSQVKLEAFIHGALCVSYSGRCYFSQHICNRSANRGKCAQVCRLPYSLVDANGNYLAKEKYLLSLKDMNRSAYIKDLIDAGISSFKIEGRLKDISYVKNVTAHYRQILDGIMNGEENLAKSSSGKSTYFFIPNIEKSFHRGSTDYFLNGRNNDITSFYTPKSIGEMLGRVVDSKKGKITIQTNKKIANGDGCCYFNEKEELTGFKVNISENNIITPSEKIVIPNGSIIYRNFDKEFEQTLSKRSAERKIDISFQLKTNNKGFTLIATDEDNITCSIQKEFSLEIAQNIEKQQKNSIDTLRKTGDTIFIVKEIKLPEEGVYFLPASILAGWRREVLAILEQERTKRHPRTLFSFAKTKHPYIYKEVDYKENIHNTAAKTFFQEHQSIVLEESFEKENQKGIDLMTCKHCLKFSMGICSKNKKNNISFKEPLYLVTQSGEKYQLSFDCQKCIMKIGCL